MRYDLPTDQIIILCKAGGILRSCRSRALNVAFNRWAEVSHRPRISLTMEMPAVVSRQLSFDFSSADESKLTPTQSRQRSIMTDAIANAVLAQSNSKPDDPETPRHRAVGSRSAMFGRRGSVILMDTLPIIDTNTTEVLADENEKSPLAKLSLTGISGNSGLEDLANLRQSLFRAQIRLRWKEAIKRIIVLRTIAVQREQKPSEPLKEVPNDLDRGVISARPIDYFIVFGVHPPKDFENVNFEQLSESQIESVLRRAQVFAGIIDRFPRQDYKDCPVSDVWTSLAFPTGILLSWVKRQPKSHFAVVTFADGRKCFLTFLQFDQPISALLNISPRLGAKELYTPKAICIVSQYPHLSTYRKILAQLYAVASSPTFPVPVEQFVSQITLELPVPIPDKLGVSLTISDVNDPIRFYASPLRDPLISRLPLRLLFDILGVDSILGIFSAMMFEQRILLHSNSLSALTIVCQTMLQLLYPFQWTSVYVPVLAEVMLDAHQCPQPYIQGVHTKYLSQFTDLNDIVLVDLDHDLIRCSSPLPRLPQQSGSALWNRLGEVMERQCSERDFVSLGSDDPFGHSSSSKFDREVTDAFLTFHADLCSGFRRFLFFINDVPFFNGRGFLKSKVLEDGSYEFLEKMIESRAFDGFLEQESEPSLYNDFLASGDVRILEKIHEVESRSVPYHEMKTPSAANWRDQTQSQHAFSRPLREDVMTPMERIKLAMTPSQMTASTRRAHKKRPQQNALAGQHDQMQYYMSQIFSNEGLSESDAKSVSRLLDHESARDCLSAILKQPLAKGPDLCLSDSSFAALAATLQTMLDCCLTYDDHLNASSVLDASTLFFCEGDQGQRIFIDSVIRDHSMWSQQLFWEKLMEKSLKKSPEAIDARREFIYDWFMNSAHKMLTLGVAFDDVMATVLYLAKVHDLPVSRIDELRRFVNKVALSMSPDND